jgi:hypothetical protein
MTATFLGVLVVTHVVLVLTGAFARAQAWSSTNIDNLGHHPLGALAASLFFLGPGEVPTPGTIAIVGIGIGGALWWLEARHGRVAAGAALLGGHVGGTVVAALVILAAVRAGIYPVTVFSAVDVGVSYGAEAAAAAAVVLLPRWASLAGVLVVVGWPILDADWYGGFPDFTTVGHLVSAAVGFTLGLLVRRRSRASTPRTGWTGSRS